MSRQGFHKGALQSILLTVWRIRAGWSLRTRRQRTCPGLLTTALLLAVGLGACSPAPTPVLQATPVSPTATVPAASSPTPAPTFTPTPEPLGSTQNPIVMGIVSGENSQSSQDASSLAEALSQKTGLSVQSAVTASYESLVDSLGNKETHLAWLPPLTYLYANQQGAAEVALLTNHFGVISYSTQFLANADSQFTVYFDPVKNQSTADAANALRQMAGKRPCWVETTSPSGYVVPVGVLATESIETLSPVILQEHTGVIRALYAGGICDFGATFGGSGDPRTAEPLLADLPDVMSRVIVIWQSDPVIPNLNLSFIPDLPQAVRVKLMNALIEMAQTEEGKKLLTGANGYEIGGLKPVEDAFYDPLRTYVDAAGVELGSLLGK